jgi:hypothetical protein
LSKKEPDKNIKTTFFFTNIIGHLSFIQKNKNKNKNKNINIMKKNISKRSSKKTSRKSSKKTSRKLSKKTSRKSSKKTSRKSSKKPKGGVEESSIINHLNDISKKLKEHKLFSFWYFPDQKGFKNKLNKMGYEDVEKMVKKDISNYKNRLITQIRICTMHGDTTGFAAQYGVLLTASANTYKIEENGKLTDIEYAIKIRWNEDDFKVSKLTFKLLERMMRISAAKKYKCVETFGCKLTEIVSDLKKKKLPIKDVLEPLI